MKLVSTVVKAENLLICFFHGKVTLSHYFIISETDALRSTIALKPLDSLLI